MKLLCVYARRLFGYQNVMELYANVEGTHNELHTLFDKIRDADERHVVHLVLYNITACVVPVTNGDETSLCYTNVANFCFDVKGRDIPQALNDIASNIQHLIE